MIAFFDSGYGGLTIAKEVIRALPQYDYVYLGDNARAPYGGRSRETIIQFASEAVEYLFAQGAQLIIFACFVASSLALREIQEKYLRSAGAKFRDRQILGVVRPIAEEAVRLDGKIGIVGTRGTIESHAFPKEIEKIFDQRDPGWGLPHAPKQGRDDSGRRNDIAVVEVATPLLVPFIEEGWHTKPEAMMILRKYLRPLKTHNIDTLILGCTHYPFMHKDFQRVMGRRVRILENGVIVAKSLDQYLGRHPELEKKLGHSGTQKFLTTDSPERFAEFAKKFVKMPKINVESVVV